MEKFIRTEEVRFRHCDAAGIVFYPRFLEMLNDLVEDWFADELHYSFSDMHENQGIPTVDLKIQFSSPARLGNVLSKELWVKSLNRSSVVCGFSFVHDNDQICLSGEVTLVHVALNKEIGRMQSQPFDAQTRDKILKFQDDGIS